MANETIYVDLVSSNNSWAVTYPPPAEGNITIQAGDSDTINWVLQTAPQGAAITAVTISPGQPGDVPWAGAEPTAANNFTTTDTDAIPAGSPAIAWFYSVTVTYDGVPYTSDPEIKNDPPTINRTAPAAY